MFPLLIDIHYLNINLKEKKLKIKVHTARDFTVNKSEKTTLSKFFKGFASRRQGYYCRIKYPLSQWYVGKIQKQQQQKTIFIILIDFNSPISHMRT